MLHCAIAGSDLIDRDLVEAVAADMGRDMRSGVAAGSAATTPAEPTSPIRLVERPMSSPAEQRIAALEERVEAQDAALRRILTLLVDWVEADRDTPSAIHDAA